MWIWEVCYSWVQIINRSYAFIEWVKCHISAFSYLRWTLRCSEPPSTAAAVWLSQYIEGRTLIQTPIASGERGTTAIINPLNTMRPFRGKKLNRIPNWAHEKYCTFFLKIMHRKSNEIRCLQAHETQALFSYSIWLNFFLVHLYAGRISWNWDPNSFKKMGRNAII